MRVLVAGDRGYIGTVLMSALRAAGHEADGLDLGLYDGCDLGPVPEIDAADPVRAETAGPPPAGAGGPPLAGTAGPPPGEAAGLARARQADMRDVRPADVEGYDAVICLAALSNDPLGDLNPAATFSVNLDGTLRLAEAARQAGVPRFLFSSSCSLYGAAGSAAVAEDAPMAPVTAYGETKVAAERALAELASDDFTPVYLRNATAYGFSPRLRLDIVVNNLTAVALTTGKVRLESDGTPWRPLVHVADISAAFLAMLTAPRELVHNQAFNVGRQEDNVQVRDIAAMVEAAVPGAEVALAAGAGPDRRSYRVDFAKLTETFPQLQLTWRVRDGIDELLRAYQAHGLSYDDFTSSRYFRLRRIRELLARDEVDEMLRRPHGRGLARQAECSDRRIS